MNAKPDPGLLSLVSGFVDRAIGADGLSPAVREKLLRQQLASVANMTPALLAVCIVVAAAFLSLTWATPRFWPVLAGTGVIVMLCAHGAFLALRPRQADAASRIRTGVWQTIVYAGLVGTLWGLVFNVLPIDTDQTARSVATIAVGGLLCISMMALVNYPQALSAFNITMIVVSL
jgi:hypothetical protein